MHEAAIVSGLMQILLGQAAKHGVDHVSRVTVKVGKLRAVEPRSLIGCFEMFAEGTIADGAELIVESVPVRCRCDECREETEIKGFVFRCSRCQGSQLTLLSGEELYIEHFET